MYRYRFVHLLAALILMLLAGPVLQAVGLGAGLPFHIVPAVLFAAMLLTAVLAVSGRARTVWIGGLLAGPAILLQVVGFVHRSDAVVIAFHLLTIGFVAYVVGCIFKALFNGIRVTLNTIYAALCVFLLLGIGWALTYSLIEICLPGSFTMTSQEAAEGFMRLDAHRSICPYYFSYVTLATLGYGDIVPVSALARMVAVLEAVTGQLYIAVTIARLVGLQIYHATEEGSGTGI